ncbi:MAG: type II secretion system protein [Clostridiales bacterium]|nr:type II secretion system protein [Clostridiales bacterium]
MKKSRLGNKGFSLLELLVGITMLAIIVVPILHAFLTSSSTSVKAKEVRNQTVAAQNIIESYETTDIGRLIADIRQHGEMTPLKSIALTSALYAYDPKTDSYDEVTAGSTDTGSGSVYRLLLKGVGDRKYDAVLNLDATEYEDRNAAGIVDYKPMDAVYVQLPPEDDGNPDLIAAKEFASQAQIDSGCVMINAAGIANNDSGVPIDANYFMNRLKRKVTVTTQKIGGTSGIIVCSALFEYTAEFNYALSDETTSPPTITHHTKSYTKAINDDFYSGIYTPDASSLYGLYFIFYPTALGGDIIEVINRNNIDLSVYLVKQNAIFSGDPDIVLRERKDLLTKPPYARLYYNSALHSFRHYLGHPGPGGVFVDYIYDPGVFSGSLVGTPAKNRLYRVTVALYEPGSIEAGKVTAGSVTVTPLATFDASSLE